MNTLGEQAVQQQAAQRPEKKKRGNTVGVGNWLWTGATMGRRQPERGSRPKEMFKIGCCVSVQQLFQVLVVVTLLLFAAPVRRPCS